MFEMYVQNHFGHFTLTIFFPGTNKLIKNANFRVLLFSYLIDTTYNVVTDKSAFNSNHLHRSFLLILFFVNWLTRHRNDLNLNAMIEPTKNIHVQFVFLNFCIPQLPY